MRLYPNLHALTEVYVFLPSLCTTFEGVLSRFSEMMLRVLVFFRCLTEVPRQTSCPFRITGAVVSFNGYCILCR